MKANRTSTAFLYVAIISFLLCVLMGELYRPWIYTNNIEDFGIAGSAVSFLGAITAVFFLLSVSADVPRKLYVFLTCLGCVIYECLQPLLGLGVFDVNDLVGIAFGYMTSCFIIRCFGGYDSFEHAKKIAEGVNGSNPSISN